MNHTPQYQAPVHQPTHWAAITSLICGCLGFLCLVSSPLAIIFGHVARSQIKNSRGKFSGSGLAMAGLILGYLWTFTTIGIGGYLYQLGQKQNFNGLNYEEARKLVKVELKKHEKEDYPADVPPPESGFKLLKYPSPIGPMDAYLTQDPGDGAKHPAMVWVVGGLDNSIGECWEKADPEDDQSASAFREAGMIMCFPSFRGGNQNPGEKENFLGEVDDLLAAVKWVKQQPYVDSKRIYLGGHSTGGTLVLLAAAAASEEFRAVISMGPVHSPANYGEDALVYNLMDTMQNTIRSPQRWMGEITVPTILLEGSEDGNADSLKILRIRKTQTANVVAIIQGADHFNVIQPVSKRLATWIKEDLSPQLILPTADDLQKAFDAAQ